MKFREIPFYMVVIAWQAFQKIKSLAKRFLTVILLLSLVGCAQVMPQLLKWDDQNMVDARATAGLVLNHWTFTNKIIEYQFKDQLDSAKVKAALKAITEVKSRYNGDPKTLSEDDTAKVMNALSALTGPAVDVLAKYLGEIIALAAKLAK